MSSRVRDRAVSILPTVAEGDEEDEVLLDVAALMREALRAAIRVAAASAEDFFLPQTQLYGSVAQLFVTGGWVALHREHRSQQQ